MWGVKFLDANSFYHFLIPLILGWFLGRRWKIGILFLVGFEILERAVGEIVKVGWFYLLSPESLWNSGLDVVIGVFGLYAGWRLSLVYRDKWISYFKN